MLNNKKKQKTKKKKGTSRGSRERFSPAAA
jgi:hypothetical protein